MSFPLLSENLIGMLWTAVTCSLAGAAMMLLAVQGSVAFRMPRVWVGVVSLMLAATYWVDLYFYAHDRISLVTTQLRSGIIWIFWPSLVVLAVTGLQVARRSRSSLREASAMLAREEET